VNFKTYSKSNKLKKRLQNDPENILVFKDTHEPIVDRMTFDLVQKHFEGRKRPDKRGELDMFAGYLYCAECGSRLYLRRGPSVAPKSNNYICGGHSKRARDCTAHYIRAKLLEEVVLSAIRSITAFAREHSEQFIEAATQRGEQEMQRLLKDSEMLKIELETRFNQLDNIIAMLYEDRTIGRITPERYDQLATKYEQEQADIKAKLADLNSQLERQELHNKSVLEFINNAKRYVDMSKLTPELLRLFIDRIEVHEKVERYSRNGGNRIDIYFTFMPDCVILKDGKQTSEEAEFFAS